MEVWVEQIEGVKLAEVWVERGVEVFDVSVEAEEAQRKANEKREKQGLQIFRCLMTTIRSASLSSWSRYSLSRFKASSHE